MDGLVVLVGLIVLVAGIALVFYNSVTIFGVTVYPNFSAGVIVAVIGFVTLALGSALGGKSRKEVEDEILGEVYGEEVPKTERTKSQKQKMTEDPVRILRLRLAKGEISKEEYEELKKRIEE